MIYVAILGTLLVIVGIAIGFTTRLRDAIGKIHDDESGKKRNKQMRFIATIMFIIGLLMLCLATQS